MNERASSLKVGTIDLRSQSAADLGPVVDSDGNAITRGRKQHLSSDDSDQRYPGLREQHPG